MSLRDFTPAPASPVQLPVPQTTRAYRRGQVEAGCAALCAAIYQPQPLQKAGYSDFTHPPGSSSDRALLRAFAYVEDGTAQLCFRGTQKWRNWLSNLNFRPTGKPLWRHAGFERAWRRLQPQVMTWLEQAAPRELVICGHSLGGAMAQLAAYDLAARWPVSAVVCFGAPLPGWPAFARAYNSTAVCGNRAQTLGDITTTYVFKSDLVRSLGLPLLGCKPIGTTIVIDATGRPNDRYLPWHVDALAAAHDLVLGPAEDTVSPLPWSPWLPLQPVQDKPLADGVTGPGIRSALTPLVKSVPQLQVALLGIGALIAAYFSSRYLVRDAGYHSAENRYAQALQERRLRWVPLAYLEHGQHCLALGDTTAAVVHLQAALQSAEAEAQSAGLSSPQLKQATWQPRLALAAAFAAQGEHRAVVACLGLLIDAFPPARQLQVDADGQVTPSPPLLALMRRAVACERAGLWAQAMADAASVLALKPDLRLQTYSTLRRRAQKNRGVGLLIFSAFNARSAAVQAETDRLLAARQSAFEAHMAPTCAWAHALRARAPQDKTAKNSKTG